MANTHNLFQKFHVSISLTSSKEENMKKSRDGLREKIRKAFADNHSGYEPKFYIQGSYKMRTAIRTTDDICDLDDGIYFFGKPDVTATTLQIWIKDAVDGYTDTPPEHRKKCIRNTFVNDYEIDMPIYHENDGQYFLAVKNSDWEESDPKAMVDWFTNEKDEKGVLVRIVKYLKAWCDFKRNKMPSGLAMTILASNAKENITYNHKRDDISLRDTLKEIQKAIIDNFECKVPVLPYDDLFADYDVTRKKNFLSALESFIQDADKALKEKNQLQSSKLWRKHLGDSFPEGEDIDDEDTKSSLSGLYSIAKESKPWKNHDVCTPTR